MVADSAARLALRSWTPVGRVNRQSGPRDFLVNFANHARMIHVPNWSRLVPGAVLQIFRRSTYDASGGLQQHPTMFLRIKSVSATGAVATPLEDVWDQPWMQLVGDSQTEYLVRRVIPTSGPFRLRVSLRGQVESDPDLLVPRGGCDVYVHQQPRLNLRVVDRVDAVTNRDGLATVTVPDAKPLFVTVLYGDQRITRGVVRGATPEPMPFEFEYMGNQTDYLNSLRWVEDKLRANQSLINEQIDRINQLAKQGDREQIRALAGEAKQFADVEAVMKRIDSIERTAKEEGVDITQAIAQTRSLAAQLIQSNRDLSGKMDQAVRFADAEGRLETIQQHFNARRWDEALEVWRQFVADFPDHPQNAKFAAFQQAATANDPQHSAARRTIAAADDIDDMKTLVSRWDDIRGAIDTLIGHDDALYLASVQSLAAEWKSVLVAEADSLRADNQRGKSLAQDQRNAMVQQLLKRKKDLETINKELTARSDRVDEAAKRIQSLF